MKLEDFYREYQDEASCRARIRLLREKQGVICKKCGHQHHYWQSSIGMWECKKCHYRTSLRAGTVMENSKLPFKYWLTAMAYLSNTKKSISALELQRQLGHKRYEPIWAMLQKLRAVMGYRDSKYTLSDSIELDEGYFEAPSVKDKGGDYYSSGDKIRVLVGVESKYVDEEVSVHRKPKKVRFLKMKVLEFRKEGQVIKESKKMIDANATVITDDHKSYKKLPDIIKEHISIRCFNKENRSQVLPWVHTAISNAKRLFLGVHHNVSKEYLQNYLNEFCYKFNRRYFGDHLFDRLLIASISTTWHHNMYESG
jgi:ribosomal protein L37AE/L43A